MQLRFRSLAAVGLLLGLSACVVQTQAEGEPTTPPPAQPAPAPVAVTEPVAPVQPAPVAIAPQPTTVTVAPVADAEPPPPPDGRYEIVMHRPATVGRTYRFSTRGEKVSRQRRALPRRPPTDETERLAVRVSGIWRTLEVDATGDVVRAEVQVEQCQAEGGGTPETLVPPGHRIVIETAQRPARGRFLVDGREPSQRVRDHLSIVFQTTRSPGNDDDVFGSPGRPRRVRESWGIQPLPMIQEFSEMFPGMTPADVRGRVTLHGVTQEAGHAYLDMGADVTMHPRQMAGLPPGTVIERGDFRVQMRGMFPRVLSLVGPRDRMSMNARMRMRIPTPIGLARLEMTITETREITRTPL